MSASLGPVSHGQAAQPSGIHLGWEASFGNAGAATAIRDLSSTELDALARAKTLTTRERDPETGRVVVWKGIPLAAVIEPTLAKLSVGERAQIDLFVFKNSEGQSVLLPRAVAGKFPPLLAFERDGRPVGPAGTYQVVLPWTSKPAIADENLPLGAMFLKSVSRIELGNYGRRFAGLYLKRRSDPVAIRGERLFVQNCTSCHEGGSVGKGAEFARTRTLASTGHAPVKGMIPLKERDLRSLSGYFQAFRAETGATAGATAGEHAGL